jgi:two-component system response regulator AtoC
MRLGGVKSRIVDVRFVAATNCNLEADVAAGRFRRDLYYRLNGVSLRVPPLRERPCEIEPLARLFLASARDRLGVASLSFAPGALRAIALHGWPGNVRELRNAVERAALLAEYCIEAGHLGLPVALENGSTFAANAGTAGGTLHPPAADSAGPGLDSDAAERDRIQRALEACAGNQSRAAKILQVPRRTLVRRIAQLGLPRPRV